MCKKKKKEKGKKSYIRILDKPMQKMQEKKRFQSRTLTKADNFCTIEKKE